MGRPAAACRHWSLGGLEGKGWSGRFVAEHASQGRLEVTNETGISIAIGVKASTGDARRTGHTIESRIHATEVDQQTNHSHANSCRLVILQLVLENFACLAAPGHGIDVDVREVTVLLAIRVSREHGGLILEDEFEKLVLNIFAPQRDAILLLQMSYLVSRVDRANRAIGLTSGTDRRADRDVMGLFVRGLGCCDGFVVWGVLDFGHDGRWLGSGVVKDVRQAARY